MKLFPSATAKPRTLMGLTPSAPVGSWFQSPKTGVAPTPRPTPFAAISASCRRSCGNLNPDFTPMRKIAGAKIIFLIVDGYNCASRDDLAAAGMKLAADLYVEMLQRELPRAH